jgi:hemolysin III
MLQTASSPTEPATLTNERFNATTHLVGAVLALLGAVALVVVASANGDGWRISSALVYGVALVAQYVSSFLYHSAKGPAKALLRDLDHCAIYLLIAGTYTPFTLVALRDHGGWPLFATIWILATLGIVRELRFPKRRRIVSLTIYLILGWLALGALVPLVARLGYHGFAWVAAGGLFYTSGIYFYVAGKKGMRHGHGIWHLFVLAGSTCHYLAVLLFVV